VWRSLFDVVVDPRAGKGTATGFTLVTFRDRRAGQLCLAFEITFAVAGNAARLGGSFSARGGTRGAARVVARGSYKQVLKRGGRVSPLGTGSARLGEPRGLPRQCRRLKAAFGPG
jgi:hypothetical protein